MLRIRVPIRFEMFSKHFLLSGVYMSHRKDHKLASLIKSFVLQWMSLVPMQVTVYPLFLIVSLDTPMDAVHI